MGGFIQPFFHQHTGEEINNGHLERNIIQNHPETMELSSAKSRRSFRVENQAHNWLHANLIP
jgi:hypothetical protein